MFSAERHTTSPNQSTSPISKHFCKMKVNSVSWIGTWNIFFLQRAIRTAILFFKTVHHMIEMIQSTSNPGTDSIRL